MQFPPQQAAGTPAAMTARYKQINDLPTLISIYQREPSMALLARIDEVREALQLQQQMQGQMAIQQAAQQPMKIGDEIIASAEQVAGMAPARKMATGGIVALQRGGDPEIERILVKPPYQRTQEENAKLEAAGIKLVQRELGPPGNWIERFNRFLEGPFLRETFTEGASRLSDEDLKKRTDAGALTEKIARGLGAQQVVPDMYGIGGGRQNVTPQERERRQAQELASAAPAPAPAAGAGGPSRSTRQRTGEANKAPPQTPPAAPAAPSSLDTALQDLLKAVAPPEISPELRAQRTKVSGIQALQEEQAQEDARRIREEVVRTGQRRMDRANLPFFDDPQALLAVAGAIDKRKGYELGSLSTGLASALAAQEARKEKAEEYVATSSEKVRALNNTYRQLQLENAKYQQALLENDTKTARESAEKITKLRYDAAVKAQELQNDRIRADAAQAKAHAAGIAAGAQAAAVPSRTEAAAQAANARLVSAINNDTMLQVYRKQLEDPLQAPNATAIENKIKTRLNELLLQYAPELTISGIGSADAGSKTRRDADAIIKQGKQ